MFDMPPAIFWLVMGMVLLITEVVTPGFVIFFFGLAAVIVGLLIWFIPSLPWTWQLILFAILSVSSLLTVRRSLRRMFDGRRSNGAQGIDDTCLGRHVAVIEAIAPPREGKVEMNGTSWTAVAAEPLEAGATAEVVGREGLTLTVKRR